MEVSLEGRSTPALGIARIDAGLLVIPIAGVPRRAVLGPGAHANPAKFPLALLARHVVAPAVLLDRALALAALLGVALDPIGGFAVIMEILEPKFCDITNDGSMISLN